MKKVFVLIIIALAAVVSFGQKAVPTYSVAHDFYEIDSVELKEKREFLVHVPLSYKNSSLKYPVVYMLDGHTPHSEMMAGIIANQSVSGKIPELILVSIRNIDRTRDMTPTPVGPQNVGGGVEKFLDYIQKEVMPVVENKYRVQPYRIFAGHSLAGLTVVHTLIYRSAMFDSYIAASPYLHWDKEITVNEAKKKIAGTKLDKTIYLGLGDEPEYQSGWNGFQKALKNVKDLDYRFEEFPDDNHWSAVLPTYQKGLRMIFKDWEPSGALTADRLGAHYRRLSKRFGYTVLPPERYMNAAGYALMRQENLTDALRVFKDNVSNYPDSSNAYDSLGDCYEKLGNKEKARENYEKSLEIATQKGDQISIRNAKSRLSKLD
jgi:predicted alpha/beta superfamily hydrolase